MLTTWPQATPSRHRISIARIAGLIVGLALGHTALAGDGLRVDNAAPAQLGRLASEADIAARAITVMPDGRGLPEGRGSVADGETLYISQCANCHGLEGQGGPHAALAGAEVSPPDALSRDPSLQRTVGNYWAYATTLFDYIRRAMPYDRPGSLSDNDTYALTAYVLSINGLLEADGVIDQDSLPRQVMPAQRFYRSAYDEASMGNTP